ncbi:redoxin domain-containing protein [Phycisphaerales bacterium AB-hyl4]|uniref:Redoxin domain-containing protein n=1 Tax=Natronomicrosphaera hydrolytica TaxID=3242702 RepID=A0ABV4U7W1_9BACT
MLSKTKTWTGLTAIAAATALAFSAAPAFAEDGPKAVVGESAPQFELPDLDGEHHSLSDYEGQIVVLHWQGIECPWEIDQYQTILSGIYRDYQSHTDDEGNQRIVFLSINSNHTEPVEAIREYVEQWDVPYPTLKDEGNEIADIYGARTTPHIFIIDEEQTLRYKGHPETTPVALADVGQGEDQYLVDALDALLAGEEIEVTDTVSRGCSIKRVSR